MQRRGFLIRAWTLGVAGPALASACRLVAAPPKAPVAKPAARGPQRLAPAYDVWLDREKKQVILKGKVVLREGPLEMFACLTGTKEHESIVACRTKAYIVHAALLALGLEAGHPVEFRPQYKPADGPEIEVSVSWSDAQGKQHQARAQEWIRNAKTKKALAEPWVFAGSGFWVDPNSNEKFYMAEDGDFICVSNFPSAMLDLPVESSQSDESRLFEAASDRIPPLETEVTVVLRPKPVKPAAKGAAK